MSSSSSSSSHEAHSRSLLQSEPHTKPINSKRKSSNTCTVWCRKYALVLSFVSASFILLLHSPDSAVRMETGNRTTKVQVNPIRQISILGERNSGTRWTYEHISECFNHTMKVERGLTRYKHWFQYDNKTKYRHDTLVLSQFRNPYDWLKAMEHVPHHSPAHLRTRLNVDVNDRSSNNDWKIFLTKPWTMERVGADLLLFGNETCQEDFLYRDIVSCTLEPLPRSYYKHKLRYSEQQPFYEMRNDGSGLPYDNILEMRTDKIRNFLSVANYIGVADVWALQYEYLVQSGTQHLLDRIQEWTGVAPRCKAKPPQVRSPKASRRIGPDFAAHIRRHLNWTVEGWIGYEIDLKYEQKPPQWLMMRRKLRTIAHEEEYEPKLDDIDDA